LGEGTAPPPTLKKQREESVSLFDVFGRRRRILLGAKRNCRPVPDEEDGLPGEAEV